MSKTYFLDTSALVKLYHEEDGTKTLDGLIRDEKPTLVISDLAVIEMTSALLKKARMHIINHEVCSQAIASFENDLPKFTVLVVEKTIKGMATALLKEFGKERGLKTLDALQLASVLHASQTSQCDLFIVTDAILAEIAAQKGLTVLNLSHP